MFSLFLNFNPQGSKRPRAEQAVFSAVATLRLARFQRAKVLQNPENAKGISSIIWESVVNDSETCGQIDS